MNSRAVIPLLSVLTVAPTLLADTVITFDEPGITDGTNITTQYANMTFTNALVQTAAIDLNEADFPPHSGANVVIDNGGPITINFQTPVFGVGGYFTYIEPLTLEAFGASSSPVAIATSMFSNNTGTGGDLGSAPNEFLDVSFAGGISEITITGDPAGGSFALDDLTIITSAPTVPESSGALTLLLFSIAASFSRKLIGLRKAGL